MLNKVKYGQFYTTNSLYIIGNLLNDLPKDLIVVEPFCGKGDLLIFEHKSELYDIDPKINNCEKRDSLKNPPDYNSKLVITNPPYLARNKNDDKTIYDLYNVGDLYKAAIKSILNCSGGILILPLNFLCDEDDTIRKLFFEKFNIITFNIFEETVFEDTSYTICSFSFKKKTTDEQVLKCNFFPSNVQKEFILNEKTGYRIGKDFLDIISVQRNIGISRLIQGGKPNSNLYLRSIDTGSEDGRISLIVKNKVYYGKISDRTFATIVTDTIYTKEQQNIICDKFNLILESNREKYNSLFLTNYRNSTSSYARKRISFEVAYKLISYIITTVKF